MLATSFTSSVLITFLMISISHSPVKKMNENFKIMSHKLKLSVVNFTLEILAETIDLCNAGKDALLRPHIVLQADLGVLESGVAVVIPSVELHYLFVLSFSESFEVHYATEGNDENVIGQGLKQL